MMYFSFRRSLLWIFLFGLNFSACKNSNNSGGNSANEAKSASKVVNLAIWTNSIAPEILEKFEKSTGIMVRVSNYSSNEELLAKLQAGADGYDIAVPSDYMVLVMKNLGLIQSIDGSRISQLSDLNPKVLKQYYDPKNEFSLPFGWGTTGIAVNKKMVKSEIRGWKDLFETKELAGKYTLLDDVRETLGAALRSQSLSLNTKDKADLEKGKKILVDAKSHVKGFTSETLAGLVNREMAVAQAYSCDALLASSQTKGDVQYVIPVEGCTLWIDNLVMPKGAKNIEAAYQLMNFLLSPEVAASRTRLLFSAPANLKSLSLLSEDLRNNKGLFPDDKVLAKCEMVQDLGESMALWERIWTEVKAN